MWEVASESGHVFTVQANTIGGLNVRRKSKRTGVTETVFQIQPRKDVHGKITHFELLEMESKKVTWEMEANSSLMRWERVEGDRTEENHYRVWIKVDKTCSSSASSSKNQKELQDTRQRIQRMLTTIKNRK